MQQFDDWLSRAWDDHVNDAAAVAARLDEGRALAGSPKQLAGLANLAHHLYGEHLGDWNRGVDWLLALADHPQYASPENARSALGVYLASLALAGGHGDAAQPLPASERVRATALAAANLATRDTQRAQALFQQALHDAQDPGLPADGPHLRALAATSNNMACALEEKALLTADERALMVQAAQAARRYWALAGGWLETERAEYRLAQSWLKAGDAEQARRHAQLCLEIVQANAAPPLEHFFGWEALGLAERAAGSISGHERALGQARQAFDALDEADRAWCRASLDKLTALKPVYTTAATTPALRQG